MKIIVFALLISGLGMAYANPFKKMMRVGWQQRTMSHASVACASVARIEKYDCPVAVQKYLKAYADLDGYIRWAQANRQLLENQLRLKEVEIATAKKIRDALSVSNFTGK